MSQPSFPQNPGITRDDAVNQIISSIAMEELGLSHILNAEGEKLQFVLGTLPGVTGPTATIEDVLSTNTSVRNMLESASYNQLFLKAKLQQALSSSEMEGPTGPTGPQGAPGPAGGVTGPIGPTGLQGAQGLGGSQGPIGPTGPIGATGPTGAVGLQGTAGAQGPQGANTTGTTAFAANTTGAGVSVTLGGVTVPLPNAQILPTGITVNGANTDFTITQAGIYRISYELNTTVGIAMGTRLIVNGSPVTAATIPALLSLSGFSAEVILNITNPTTVSLGVFGITATANLVTGTGAALMIMRLA